MSRVLVVSVLFYSGTNFNITPAALSLRGQLQLQYSCSLCSIEHVNLMIYCGCNARCVAQHLLAHQVRGDEDVELSTFIQMN